MIIRVDDMPKMFTLQVVLGGDASTLTASFSSEAVGSEVVGFEAVNREVVNSAADFSRRVHQQ